MVKHTTGSPVPGSYGNWAVIERPPVKISKVSCQMCHYYDTTDHSCGKGYIGPKDNIDRWKKCKEFILDPFYRTLAIEDKIREEKGTKFLEAMLEKSSALLVDIEEYRQRKSTQKKPDNTEEDNSGDMPCRKLQEKEELPVVK